MATQAEQDYLKIILDLEEAGEQATTSSVADRQNVSPASVTGMMGHLASKGLVDYTPYHGAHLTDAGYAVALETTRHHRIIELYLQQVLGLPWDEVHAEADRLEHVISESLEDRLDRALGYPAVDPHGDPIPSRDGRLPVSSGQSLAQVLPGERVRLIRVTAQHPEILRYLASLGMVPGAEMIVKSSAPFDGPITVAVAGQDQAIAAALAQAMYVTIDTEYQDVPNTIETR